MGCSQKKRQCLRMGEGPLQSPNPCVHLCPSYLLRDLLRSICLPPISVGKDENEHSTHMKVTCAQSSHSCWYMWKLFYCPYFVQRAPYTAPDYYISTQDFQHLLDEGPYTFPNPAAGSELNFSCKQRISSIVWHAGVDPVLSPAFAHRGSGPA